MRHKDKIRDMESLLLSYVKSMFSVSHDLLTTVSDKISQMAYSELSLKEELSGKRNGVLLTHHKIENMLMCLSLLVFSLELIIFSFTSFMYNTYFLCLCQ